MDKVKVSEDAKRLDDKIAANSFYSAQAQDTFYIDSDIFEKQSQHLNPPTL